MATTNGVKKFSIAITKEEGKLLVRALDVVRDQIKRSMAKEGDSVILQRKEAQIMECQQLANVILYDGKEIV